MTQVVPYGKLTVCYWKWTIEIGDLPIQIVISHGYVCLPEGFLCPIFNITNQADSSRYFLKQPDNQQLFDILPTNMISRLGTSRIYLPRMWRLIHLDLVWIHHDIAGRQRHDRAMLGHTRQDAGFLGFIDFDTCEKKLLIASLFFVVAIAEHGFSVAETRDPDSWVAFFVSFFSYPLVMTNSSP